LEEIVGSALNRLEKNLGDRPVTICLPDDLPLLWIDAVLLEQVLANLIENVIKYTPPNSPMDISAERLAASITVTVSDYGQGIPKGMEEKIFAKFYRLESDSLQSGVGLGLTLCRAIIEAHGGIIYARQQSPGAAFVIELPAHQQPPLNWHEALEA
jgi:K+-sensing histidine kinase KdpD